MATRARVPNSDPPANDPPRVDPPANDPTAPATPVNCTCPVCKSVVVFENGALTGGETSAEYNRLVERTNTAAVLEGELAAANAKIATLEESAAGDDPPDPPEPAPKSKTNFFLD